MREVGVDSSFLAADVGYSLSQLDIHLDCEKRLLDIELDLGSSVCTFEAVKWAISELQRMELRQDYCPATEDDPGGRRSSDRSSSRVSGETHTGSKDVEQVPTTLLPGRLDLEKKEALPASVTGAKSDCENLDEKRDGIDASPSGGPKLDGENAGEVGIERWSDLFQRSGVGKRKPNEGVSANDGEKRAKVDTVSRSTTKEVVLAADQGDAGKRMAERINSRLANPECIFLTNLVGHCLLVSMDQVPAKSVQQALDSVSSNDAAAENSAEDNGSSIGEWMWLHRWLVRIVLSDNRDSDHYNSLDWLVAYLTATRQSIIRPILEDLALDLRKREAEGSPTLASYMRRTGVLEYAALRDPERTFGSLHSLFPPAVFPAQSRRNYTGQTGGCYDLWQGWLGLMVLCPKLFSAFSRFWVPTLSAEVAKSWRFDCSFSSLPAIWTILVDTHIEEPRNEREWICAAIIRRLPEIAPFASYFVVLVSGLDSPTDHGATDGCLGFWNYLLVSVYKELSKEVLPKVLGLPVADKMTGTNHFMEDLKKHSHILWRKSLECYSASNCSCCQIPPKKADPSSRTETGDDDGSTDIERDEDEVIDFKSKQAPGVDVQRGCLYRDPLIQLCQLTLLCCSEHVVADLLASASIIKPCAMDMFEPQLHKRLLMVMRVMRIVWGQGRGVLILEIWAQRIIEQVTIASDEQALLRILALRQLLDPTVWENYHTLLGSSSDMKDTEEAVSPHGLSWKSVWKVVHMALDERWLHILPLMHREGSWELRLAVLGVLQLLNADGSRRPQAVADRLKGVLGLFFSLLEMPDGHLKQTAIGHAETRTATFKLRRRWQSARAMEHLKSIIVELGSSSFPSFTLMVNSLLDFSFEHNIETSTIPFLSSTTNHLSKTERSQVPSRRVGSASRSSFCVAPLSTGRLDRYGKLMLVSASGSEVTSALPKGGMKFTEENNRIQSGSITSLQLYKDRPPEFSRNTDMEGKNDTSRTNRCRRSKVLEAELGSLLRRTLEMIFSQGAEPLDAWPCHPVSVLATHLTDRLETPHELPMTMEQYEEILPKHISSLRHIFLTNCFSQNPLLMEVIELVYRHGENRDVLRCVEFVRVLLADSISWWHSAFRARRPQSLPHGKVEDEDSGDRVLVNRLIQLVASANWLPQPLAASGEIVSVIDGVDISDLLLLVWRCMHHAMAFGTKGWGGPFSNLHTGGASADGQATSTSTLVDEEAGKEGTYTEWEGHFFAILRRNVSHIGAYFAQVYPLRKTL